MHFLRGRFSELGVLVDMDGLIGVFLVMLTAICFGTNPIFARLGYEAGANPTTYLFKSLFDCFAGDPFWLKSL